jgi:hypothetical protein
LLYHQQFQKQLHIQYNLNGYVISINFTYSFPAEIQKLKELYEQGFIQESEYFERLNALSLNVTATKYIAILNLTNYRNDNVESPKAQPPPAQKPQQKQPPKSTYTYTPKTESAPTNSPPQPTPQKAEIDVVSTSPIPMPVIRVPKQINQKMVFTSSLVIMPPPEQWEGIILKIFLL